jgi:hypothetical protein
MALDVTVNISDELESILIRRVAELNSGTPTPPQTTPAQYVRQVVREDLRAHRRRYDEIDRMASDPIRQLMTPEDRAIFDALRDKYRNA